MNKSESNINHTSTWKNSSWARYSIELEKWWLRVLFYYNRQESVMHINKSFLFVHVSRFVVKFLPKQCDRFCCWCFTVPYVALWMPRSRSFNDDDEWRMMMIILFVCFLQKKSANILLRRWHGCLKAILCLWAIVTLNNSA